MPMLVPRIRTKYSLPSTTLTPLRVEKPGLPVVTGMVLITSPLRLTVIWCVAASVMASIRSPMVSFSGFDGAAVEPVADLDALQVAVAPGRWRSAGQYSFGR